MRWSKAIAIVCADGRLCFRHASGHMVLSDASPAGYKQHGVFPIPNSDKDGNRSWSHPVVAGGKLWAALSD